MGIEAAKQQIIPETQRVIGSKPLIRPDQSLPEHFGKMFRIKMAQILWLFLQDTVNIIFCREVIPPVAVSEFSRPNRQLDFFVRGKILPAETFAKFRMQTEKIDFLHGGQPRKIKGLFPIKKIQYSIIFFIRQFIQFGLIDILQQFQPILP